MNLLPSGNRYRGEEVPFATLSSDTNRYIMDNGMVVITREVYPSSVVFLSLWARVGSADELNQEAGISHFVEHMLFKNTKKRQVGQIAQEIHSLGGYINGFTSFDCTAYWMVLPDKNFHKALEIQYDAIFNPLLDPKEIEKECNVIIEELKMYKDTPSSYLTQQVMATAFKKHNYGRPVIGFEEVLREITPQRLKEYYNNYYKANNTFILASGCVDGLDIMRKSERTYRKLREGRIERPHREEEPWQTEMRRIETEGDTLTGHLHLAFHIPSIFNKDIYPIELATTILGEGRSSRLYQELREKRKLVNSVFAYTYIQKDPCLMFIEIEAKPENIPSTEKAVFEILQQLVEEGPTQEELQRAKNRKESAYIYGQETVEGQGKKTGLAEIMGDYMLMEKFISRLLTTQDKDMKRVLGKYLIPSNCTVGIYMPKKKE